MVLKLKIFFLFFCTFCIITDVKSMVYSSDTMTTSDISKRNFIALDANFATLSLSYGRIIKNTNWGIGGGIGYLRAVGFGYFFSEYFSISEYLPVRLFAVYNRSFFTCETGIRASIVEFPPDKDDRYSEAYQTIFFGIYLAPMIGWKNIKAGPVIVAGTCLLYTSPSPRD